MYKAIQSPIRCFCELSILQTLKSNFREILLLFYVIVFVLLICLAEGLTFNLADDVLQIMT